MTDETIMGNVLVFIIIIILINIPITITYYIFTYVDFMQGNIKSRKELMYRLNIFRVAIDLCKYAVNSIKKKFNDLDKG